MTSPTHSTDRENLTIPGSTVGTAAVTCHLEQARGEKLDARTDLVLSFRRGAYTRWRPVGRPLLGRLRGRFGKAILTRQPTPPQRLNPAIEPRLQAIIEKALEKDREARYPACLGDSRRPAALEARHGPGTGRAGPCARPEGRPQGRPYSVGL